MAILIVLLSQSDDAFLAARLPFRRNAPHQGSYSSQVRQYSDRYGDVLASEYRLPVFDFAHHDIVGGMRQFG